jgi:hypothetical protein
MLPEAIKEELAQIPLKIGLSQFGLANHEKLNQPGVTCCNNVGLVLGNFSALDRKIIAGTVQTLECTDCHAAFNVPIPQDFH